MKIREVYYLNDPEDLESDWFEMCVGVDPTSPNEIGGEFSFSVTTTKFIDEWMRKNDKKYYCDGHIPLLIVTRLDDETVLQALQEILPQIEELGCRTE